MSSSEQVSFYSEAAVKRLKEIYADTSLSKFDRKLAAMPILKLARDELDSLVKEANKLSKEEKRLTAHIDAANAIKDWLLLPAKLEKNDCSRYHKFVAAGKNGLVFAETDDDAKFTHEEGPQIFVVCHDWASAFSNAQDFNDGEFQLPYDLCAFEFRITGRNVIIVAKEHPDGLHYLPLLDGGSAWCAWNKNKGPVGAASEMVPFLTLAHAQIRAISIALDAEVATQSIIRAPHKLNMLREKEGKTPLYDYSVVMLNGAHRANRRPFSGSGTHRSPRLHFRRGHWRHYLEHKTWVRWTLVGNPELGFIDKEYRL